MPVAEPCITACSSFFLQIRFLRTQMLQKHTTKKAFKIMHPLISRQAPASWIPVWPHPSKQLWKTIWLRSQSLNAHMKNAFPMGKQEAPCCLFGGQCNASSPGSSLLHDQMRNALPRCLYSSNYAGKVSYYDILLLGPNMSAGFDMGYDRVIMRWHHRKGIGEGQHLRSLWNGKYSPLNQNIRACNLLLRNNVYCFSLHSS